VALGRVILEPGLSHEGGEETVAMEHSEKEATSQGLRGIE
jgi:hypothetical protein